MSQVTPIFYFVLSFSLFTDIIFQGVVKEQGIMNTLYTEVMNEGLTVQFLSWVMAMLVLVVLVRILTSFPLRVWEFRHGIDNTRR